MDKDPLIKHQVYTVMIVDDDDNWCFISKRLLKKAGVQKEIITAYNGLEANKKLQELKANKEDLPDMIFLDINMPVMDGFEFLEEITKNNEFDLSKTKIYICSSSLHPKDKNRAKSYPVSGFVTKPLTQQSLNDILQAV